MVEAGSQNESLVGESLTVGEFQGVVVGVEGDELGPRLNLGPVVNLSLDSGRQKLLIAEVGVANTEVNLRTSVYGIVRDKSHLEVHLVGKGMRLDVLGQSSRVDTTYTSH